MKWDCCAATGFGVGKLRRDGSVKRVPELGDSVVDAEARPNVDRLRGTVANKVNVDLTIATVDVVELMIEPLKIRWQMKRGTGVCPAEDDSFSISMLVRTRLP